MTSQAEAAGLLGGHPSVRGSFGQGGAHPYERALVVGGAVLRLHPLYPVQVLHPAHAASMPPSWSLSESSAARPSRVDVSRFLRRADRVDRVVLRRTSGSVLDVGCGPGRMLAEAVRAGRPALGIDVSSSAVALATRAGLPVQQSSVFDAVPDEGGWHTVLLLDGNIGIGGDPRAIVARCAELLAPGGTLVVETHRDPRHARAYAARLLDEEGRASSPFPWAEIGSLALLEQVDSEQWQEFSPLRRRRRCFVLLRRAACA